MLVSILLLITGLVLVVKGADWMVDGASAFARRHNISDLVIGLTIVSFGTSAPEIIINTMASFEHHHDIVFGNILGTNIFNLYVVLGITGLIAPIMVQSSAMWREIPISIFVTLLVFLLCNDFFVSQTPTFSRMDGIILLITFAAFLYYVYTHMKAVNEQPETPHHAMTTFKMWLLMIVGFGGLFLGGKLVVDYAVKIASALGVSEKIIAMTIVAGGTSLPEVVISSTAALKKRSGIAIGIVIGSNVFNILLVLALSAIIAPVPYSSNFNPDFYVLIGGTIFLFIAMLTGNKKKLDRWEAAVFFIGYILYTLYLILRE